MPDIPDETLREMILELLQPKLADAQVKASLMSLDDDLYELGIVDSYDVVELLSEITEKTGIEVDFGNAEDGDKFTLSVNSLSDLFLDGK